MQLYILQLYLQEHYNKSVTFWRVATRAALVTVMIRRTLINVTSKVDFKCYIIKIIGLGNIVIFVHLKCMEVIFSS